MLADEEVVGGGRWVDWEAVRRSDASRGCWSASQRRDWRRQDNPALPAKLKVTFTRKNSAYARVPLNYHMAWSFAFLRASNWRDTLAFTISTPNPAPIQQPGQTGPLPYTDQRKTQLSRYCPSKYPYHTIYIPPSLSTLHTFHTESFHAMYYNNNNLVLIANNLNKCQNNIICILIV